MVQGQYGLRARAVHGRRRGILSAEDLQQPAAAATVGAGLQPGVVTKAERLAFGGRHAEYLEARNLVLQKWHEDVTRYLSVEECVAAASPAGAEVVREAHAFLQGQGCINSGLLPDTLAEPLGHSPVTEERIAAETLKILQSVDMAATTERMIRKQLEEVLKVKVDIYKDFIRSQVLAYIQGKPLPPPTAAAAATGPPKLKGRVIVVGAGPAGLAAAMHLKRCGAEAVVLEARSRVGGRVYTHHGGGFSVPIDLGASIITGTATDLAKSARADPSAILARQLGVGLHELGRALPIFDGVTGAPVAPETDARIEALVNHLLDAAREGVDEAEDDPARPDTSLGDALEQALAAHLEGAGRPPLGGPPEGLGASLEVPADRPAGDGAACNTGVSDRDGAAAASQAVVAEAAGGAAATAMRAAEPAESKGSGGAAPASAECAGAVAPPEAEGMRADSLAGGDGQGAALDVAPEASAHVLAEPHDPRSELEVSARLEGVSGAVARTDAGSSGAGLESAAEGPPRGPGAGLLDAAAPVAAPASIGSEPGAPDPAAGPTEGTAGDAAAGGVPALGQGRADASAALASPAQVPAVGPAVGVSGRELGEVTTAAAEAVARDLERQQDADGGAPAAPLVELPSSLSDSERRLLDWHWANLEYGCSARLNQVSMAHWNQDDEYGGFGGPHAMVRGGYSGLLEPLAARLDVRLGAAVASIVDSDDGVSVTTTSGEVFSGAAVIVTVPLGCLKAGAITFQPVLPDWKASAIQKLGFGNLNKVVLEFPEAFWDVDADYFGAALPGGAEGRGRCFMFWNLQRVTGAPVLTALAAGAAAGEAETASDAELGAAALEVLRRVYGADIVPEPRCVLATRWASEEFTRGSYSYVAVGASGRTYDQLAAPVRRRLLFAGEHTCKEHPDTVGGAMLTGVREAVRALSLLRGDDGNFGAAAAEDVATGSFVKRRTAQAEKERRPRKRRAEDDSSGDERAMRVYRDPALVAAEQAQREAARDGHRQLWVALMAGDTETLEGLLEGSTGADARGALAAELAKARPDMLRTLAGHLGCLRALNIWLLDLAADLRAFHILELLLQVLKAMPVQWGQLKQSGVAATVRQRAAEHPNRSVRAAVAAVTQRWAEAAGDASIATAPLQAPGAGAAVAALALPARREVETPSPSEEAAEVLDEGVRRRLAEAEAAAQEAAALKQEAALVEAAVAEAEATGAAQEDAALPDIPEFSYVAGKRGRHRPSRLGREAKLARRKARAAQAEADGDGAASEDLGRKAAPAAAGAGDRSSASSQARAKASASSGGSKVKREVTEYVKSLLKPLYTAKRISKEQFKLVVEKSANKVVEQAGEAGSVPFLSEKRQAKVRALVDKYLKRHTGADSSVP